MPKSTKKRIPRRLRPSEKENPDPANLSFCLDCNGWLSKGNFNKATHTPLCCYCKSCHYRRTARHWRRKLGDAWIPRGVYVEADRLNREQDALQNP